MRRVNLITIFCFLLFLFGCSTTPKDQSAQIFAINNATPSKINAIRQTALQETASEIGAQAALAWKANELNNMLATQSRRLDRVFNFEGMLLDHNVLPPVLVEARNTLNLSDNATIRLSSRDYQIIFPARFVTAPPTWRDYLLMIYKKPEIPNNTLLPKNNDEIDIWNKYLRIGWLNGLEQAYEIFSANLNRLQRDFGGMVLYRKLYAQQLVSKPYVSAADLGVTGGGNAMRINDRILRITSTSELDPNSKHWNPVLPADKKPGMSTIPKHNAANLKSLLEKIQ